MRNQNGEARRRELQFTPVDAEGAALQRLKAVQIWVTASSTLSRELKAEMRT